MNTINFFLKGEVLYHFINNQKIDKTKIDMKKWGLTYHLDAWKDDELLDLLVDKSNSKMSRYLQYLTIHPYSEFSWWFEWGLSNNCLQSNSKTTCMRPICETQITVARRLEASASAGGMIPLL